MQRQVNGGEWNNSYASTAANVEAFVDTVSPGTKSGGGTADESGGRPYPKDYQL